MMQDFDILYITIKILAICPVSFTLILYRGKFGGFI